MSRTLLERRLADVGTRAKRLRDELFVIDEQLEVITSEADDARLRALVSETPLAEREHTEARRQVEAMQRHRRTVVDELEQLDRTQDELLDRLAAQLPAAPAT